METFCNAPEQDIKKQKSRNLSPDPDDEVRKEVEIQIQEISVSLAMRAISVLRQTEIQQNGIRRVGGYQS